MFSQLTKKKPGPIYKPALIIRRTESNIRESIATGSQSLSYDMKINKIL